MNNTAKLNRNATLDEIGLLVKQTAEKLCEGEWDAATDHFIELNYLLFPDDFDAAPAPENDNIPEYEKFVNSWHAAYLRAGGATRRELPDTPSADCLILQDDDLINANRTEAETLQLLHRVQNQILDGEREPEAFLEAMEHMYRLAYRYTEASTQAAQRVEQAEARLVQLVQQNQRLLGMLTLISQGADHIATPAN